MTPARNFWQSNKAEIIGFITILQGVAVLWLQAHFVTKDEFQKFKDDDYGAFRKGYWERVTKTNELLSKIDSGQNEIKSILQERKENTNNALAEIKRDVRDLSAEVRRTNP